MIIFRIIVMAVACLSFPLSSLADIKAQSKAPIHITSEQLEVDQKAHKATYSGKVIAVQDQLEVNSDKLTVFYWEEGKKAPNAEGDIEKIEVKHNVKLKKQNKRATGNFGIYDLVKDTIHLYGNVTLLQGDHLARGDELVYHLATDYTELKSHQKTEKPSRVKAIIVPKDQKE